MNGKRPQGTLYSFHCGRKTQWEGSNYKQKSKSSQIPHRLCLNFPWYSILEQTEQTMTNFHYWLGQAQTQGLFKRKKHRPHRFTLVAWRAPKCSDAESVVALAFVTPSSDSSFRMTSTSKAPNTSSPSWASSY